MIKFKKFYKYDSDKLTYTPISKLKPLIIGLTTMFCLFFIGLYIGIDYGSPNLSIQSDMGDILTKEDRYPTQNKVWVDSTFKDYKIRSSLYLTRPRFSGTPLTGELLTFCARNAYDSTGILVPVELALAQCQWESSFGREGKSPKRNPFNIGENDSGTVKWFDSTNEGVQAYYYLMSINYLKCKTVEELLFNFTNCSGKRYASGDYELHISNQYFYIKRWLDSALKR